MFLLFVLLSRASGEPIFAPQEDDRSLPFHFSFASCIRLHLCPYLFVVRAGVQLTSPSSPLGATGRSQKPFASFPFLFFPFSSLLSCPLLLLAFVDLCLFICSALLFCCLLSMQTCSWRADLCPSTAAGRRPRQVCLDGCRKEGTKERREEGWTAAREGRRQETRESDFAPQQQQEDDSSQFVLMDGWMDR